MAFKVHVTGNRFLIDDLITLIRYEGLAKEVLIRTKTTTSTDIGFTNVNGWSNTKTIDFSEIDLTDAPYTDFATFIDWADQELGKSSPQAGGSTKGKDIFSWIDYNDTGGSTNLVANTWTNITNDGQGAFSNSSTPPLAGGVTSLINVSDGTLDFTQLDISDIVFMRWDFSVFPNTNNSSLDFRFYVGETGQEYPLNLPIPRLDKGAGIEYPEAGLFELYMGDLNTLNGGAILQVRSDSAGSFINRGIVLTYFKYD